MADISSAERKAARVRMSLPRLVMRRLNAKLVFGGGIMLVLLVTALFAQLLAPHDPLDQDLLNALLPPCWVTGGDPSFILGTDDLGRDILSRLIFGARVTVTVALAAAVAACILGSFLGLVAGFMGGVVDQIVSRLIDIWVAFPPMLMAMVLTTVIGAGLGSVIIAIMIVDWTRFARVVRAEAQIHAASDYATAARVVGMRPLAVMLLEVLPNVVPLVITLLSVEMGIAVIVEAALAFVGESITSGFPTWGGMIATGRGVINQAWWMLVAPAACIMVAVLGFNMLGDGLRRLLDPVNR